MTSEIKCKRCTMAIPSDSRLCPCCGNKINNSLISEAPGRINTASEKKCRHCAMMIPAEAKTCPYCRKNAGLPWPVKLLIGVFLIGIIGAFLPMVRPNTQNEFSTQKETKSIKAPPANNHTPIQYETISITPDRLHEEYAANEVAADQKYKNKNIRVSGVIRNISKDVLDQPYVIISTTKYSKTIMISFPRKVYDDMLAEQRIGNQFEITGICKGLTLSMVMVDVK